MKYPISIILQFREVAVATFYAQELFQRKKKSLKGNLTSRRASSSGGGGVTSSTRHSILGSTHGNVNSGGGAGAGAGGTGGSSGSNAVTQAPVQDFQQAMTWRDILHMITILKDEQHGIVSDISTLEEEHSTHPSSSHAPIATSHSLPLVTASTTSHKESVKDTVKELVKEPSKSSITTPATGTSTVTSTSTTSTIPPTTPTKLSDDIQKSSTPSSSTVTTTLTPSTPIETTPENNSKFSFGISLKKGGPTMEVSIPSLKMGSSNNNVSGGTGGGTGSVSVSSAASKTAANLFSSMKLGFDQFGSDVSNLSASTPSGKKNSILDSSSSAATVISSPKPEVPMEVC